MCPPRNESSQAGWRPLAGATGRHLARLAAAFTALAVLVGVGAAPATASTGRFHFGYFGPDGTEDTTYQGNGIKQLAFDQAANDLFAISNPNQHAEIGYCLDRFHTAEAGLPARPKGFAAAGGGSICGIATELRNVAVDNSTTATQSHIYVVGAGKLFGFDSNGAPLGGNFPLSLQGQAVAVDSLGDIWVSTGEGILEYDSSGKLLGKPIEAPSGAVDLDSGDNLYGLVGGKILRYAKAGGYTSAEEIDPGNPLPADVIAIDRGDDHLLVHRGQGQISELDEYDLDLPGYPEIEGSPVAEDVSLLWGIAVDGEAGVIYISDFENRSKLGIPGQAIDAYSRYGTHPEVSTNGTSGVTNSTATLTGAVDPEGTVTQCHFEYGPSDAYGTSVPCASGPGAGKGAVEVHADLSGLKASSLYHYRLVAENAIGAVPGEDALLSTFGPPAISDAGFDAATTTTADVSAKINPANQVSTYRVEYTPEAAYEANTPVDEQQELSIGASSGTFTLSYEGQKTAALDFNSSAAEVEEALDELSSIGDVGGSVTVSGGPGDAGATSPYEIVFGGSLGGEDVPQIEVDGADLEGGSEVAEVQTTTPGHSRFAGALAIPATDGQIPEGTADVTVPVTIPGLSPGSAYRFRYLAKNVSGTSRGEALKAQTYAPVPPQTDCPNQAFRSGPSATLPDCRAYEVVSGELHGGIPEEESLGTAVGSGGGRFATELASPDGQSLIFGTPSGALPGTGGNGTDNRYDAVRGPNGWSKQLVSPSGAQGTIVHGGGLSPEHEYSTWVVEHCCGGNLSNPKYPMRYLRRPDGSFELIGQGDPGFESDPDALVVWIAPHGSHIVFRSEVGGTPNPPLAPGANEGAIYDRTPSGLRVVSLLPEEQPLGLGENAEYQGASADGSVVAFKVQSKAPLYLRLDNQETVQAVGATNTFAGLSADGDRLFYLKNGDVFSYDVAAEAETKVTTKAEATVVNVSADGSHVYFASKKVLDGAEEGTLGKDNLYVWDEANGQTRFIATLDPEDLSGEVSLAKWVSAAVNTGNGGPGPGRDPSQATPDGSAFLFQSFAQLTPYDNEGHAEIYRYEQASRSLSCLSCSPIGTRPRSDAALRAQFGPINGMALIHNISDDGKRAFFETYDALVEEDTDGFADVYEWEAQGEGSCKAAAGCLYLITSGKSLADREGLFAGDYLYAATPDGEDVFVRSDDLLVPDSGEGGSAAIYDVKVGGGFSYPSAPIPCQGDSCKGKPTSEPAAQGAGSAVFSGPGNPQPKAPRCAKGRHMVRKAGKTRCVKRGANHHKRHRHRKGARR